MTQNKQAKVPLTQFFQAVDRRLERTGLMPAAAFRVRVCGKLLELRYPNGHLAEVGKASLVGRITQDSGQPDATLLYWYDQCDAYLPPGEAAKSSVWKSRDTTGALQVVTDSGFIIGCDHARQRYYYARPRPTGTDLLLSSYAMSHSFGRWARANGMLMLHAAAVGVQGKGVLIAGKSGSGKSTFAASCLAEGLDFVADDYSLLSGSGPLRAMPLYTMVSLNPDMCEKLPRFGEPLPKVAGSFLAEKPRFRMPLSRFCEALSIHAIVIPAMGGEAPPSIRAVPPGRAMAPLIHSSMTQMEFYRDTTLIRQISARLKDLPTYEMHMSADLKKNPAFLRRFIEKEF